MSNSDIQAKEVLDYALRYHAAGYSVISLKLDGSKKPVASWKHFIERGPTVDEVHQMFLRPAGIGILCGPVSGGLECIDFDMAELLFPLLSMLSTDLQNRLSIYETPGGWHLFYRCSEVCGNRKLSSWEKSDSLSQQQNGHRIGTGFKPIGKGARIETRGEGGFFVAEGSPCSVHDLGIPYVHYMGPTLETLVPILPLERKSIWEAAMTFECGVRESKAVKRAKQKIYQETHGDIVSSGDEPWVWFDQNGSIPALLQNAGWKSFGGDSQWTRPGKTHGISAVMGKSENGINILTVFSTSTELGPVNGEDHRTWGAFNLLTELQFGRNKKEAAKYVRTLMPKPSYVHLDELLRNLGAA